MTQADQVNLDDLEAKVRRALASRDRLAQGMRPEHRTANDNMFVAAVLHAAALAFGETP
jgi:hypothetical protein